MPTRIACLTTVSLLLPFVIPLSSVHGGAPPVDLVATLQARCVKCHGEDGTVEGDVNLLEIKHRDQLASRVELLGNLIEVLDSAYMPPEDEPQLDQATRQAVVRELRKQQKSALAARPPTAHTPLRRMNRFQYNNAVQDLFQLSVEVFPLPERMLREHGNYFQPQTGKMPRQVRVGSRPLGKSQLIERRLAGVTPFPQDLRAEHGFDNRADHLSLSPLQLEAFLKLSRSIVESPDFNDRTCGIWKSFFAPPPGVDVSDSKEAEKLRAPELRAAIDARLRTFLSRAFRRPADERQVKRYGDFVVARIQAGDSFPTAMKQAAAAVLASPRFFYLYDQHHGVDAADRKSLDDFDLASRLSFLLWGSLPDATLMQLAADGTLHRSEVLAGQVDRMLRDRRLKRFCDSFPAQWLQLDRIISSTPDREKYPQFYFAKYRVSMHMMLEPLLVFETLLVENRSVLQLIDSDFSYRSELLNAWYRDGSAARATPVVIGFRRVPVTDRRQGGVLTTAAVMTMTSAATRTQPITRGAWLASVILNDPPEPPPADVPPLADRPGGDEDKLTLRERFAAHRTRADCAGCHRRIDPLGFALENYDPAGIWRDKYPNGRKVDPSGTLFGKHKFNNIVEFKDALLAEKNRFTRALAEHLLAFATAREVGVDDALSIEQIVKRTADDDYRFHTLIKQIVLSESFRR